MRTTPSGLVAFPPQPASRTDLIMLRPTLQLWPGMLCWPKDVSQAVTKRGIPASRSNCRKPRAAAGCWPQAPHSLSSSKDSVQAIVSGGCQAPRVRRSCQCCWRTVQDACSSAGLLSIVTADLAGYVTAATSQWQDWICQSRSQTEAVREWAKWQLCQRNLTCKPSRSPGLHLASR